MSKTNKELAIDVVVAAINANPKMVSSSNAESGGLNEAAINDLIKTVYHTVSSLGKDTK